ncbi:hypothetical protein ACXU4B_12690 [Dyella soli]|uniref:Uncharacterized protein n=1 Tax=Dyella soli TaxID=522319 RepID=A0A4V6N9W7_9GAMM|nr:hypothetical protein EZM97_30750 [Dyella soli]
MDAAQAHVIPPYASCEASQALSRLGRASVGAREDFMRLRAAAAMLAYLYAVAELRGLGRIAEPPR